MNDVLIETAKILPAIKLRKIFIDQDPTTTNNFGINKNPTTLFLSGDEKELTRVEGFKETSEIAKMIEHGNFEKKTPIKKSAPSLIEEQYTIYLMKDSLLHPFQITYENQTNVTTPRITAVNVLLSTAMEGYINPFSNKSKLNLIEFEGSLAKVYISDTDVSDEENNRNREACLLETLRPFGITQVQLV